MILDHIARCTACIIIASARADPEAFRHRDLHTINVFAIPEWLEDRVTKSLHKQILHGFLPEVVVDTVNLSFLEDAADHLIQLMSRLQVPAKRFFDDNLRGKLSADMRLSHTTTSKVFNNRLKNARWCRDIEHALHIAPQALFDFINLLGERIKCCRFIVSS